MTTLIALGIGTIISFHVASYGAYKDSPYERFQIVRYIREILLGTFIAGILYIFFPQLINSGFVVFFLVVLAVSRILTEGYKLFIRVESQEAFLIPTQMHWFRTVVKDRIKRILLGLLLLSILIVFIAAAYLVSYVVHSAMILGAIVGLLSGTATAMGGGYKDGYYEGFIWNKFFRSPIVGASCGLLLSFFTVSPIALFLGAVGLERMIVEGYKAFLKPNYFPGKFKNMTPAYPEYVQKRKLLLIPYLSTWIVFLAIFLTEILAKISA